MYPKPVISVIVPTYNEAARIGACVQALRRQTVSVAYEIIVSDNGSTDQTKRIARSGGARVITDSQKGYSSALRRGILLSRCNIVVLTEADCIPEPMWLAHIYRLFSDGPDVIAVGGPFSFYDGPVWVRWFVDFSNAINPHFLTASLCGMNMAFRRDAYHRVGGFDASVNLQTDTQLGFRLIREGAVVFDRRLLMRASGRRYQSFDRVLSEVARRVTNVIAIRLTGKPVLYAFADVRR